MSEDSNSYSFRGFAEVAGHSYRANASWFGCGCTITPRCIAIHVFGYDHVHLRPEILELRWFWLPFPTVIVVSRIEGQYCYSSFQVLRWTRLRSALASCGFVFTEETRYCRWRRIREDSRKYELYDGIAP
jgi:hypothetical protein